MVLGNAFYPCSNSWAYCFINISHLLLQLKDLLYFLIIVSFVILGVGMYYHTLRFQSPVNRSEWTKWEIWSILYYPYWQMYAEFNLDYLSGKNISFNVFLYIDKWVSLNGSFLYRINRRLCLFWFALFSKHLKIAYFHDDMFDSVLFWYRIQL